MSWLTRGYEIEINFVPSLHAEAVTKTPVVTESAKHCVELVIRMIESLSSFRTSLFIFIAKAKLLKFS